MSSEAIGFVMIAVMLLAIFVGFPISFTLIFLGLVFGAWGFGPKLVVYLMTLQFNNVMLEQTLAAVPLFIFMGILMEQGGADGAAVPRRPAHALAHPRRALHRGAVRLHHLRGRHRHRRGIGDDSRHHGREDHEPVQLRREARGRHDHRRRHAGDPDPAVDHARGPWGRCWRCRLPICSPPPSSPGYCLPACTPPTRSSGVG